MKDPKGRKIIGFDKHVFVCENVREENHPRKCCSSKTKSNIKILFKNELKKYENTNIRINSAGCLDFCEQGPTVVVYPESIWYSIKNQRVLISFEHGVVYAICCIYIWIVHS